MDGLIPPRTYRFLDTSLHLNYGLCIHLLPSWLDYSGPVLGSYYERSNDASLNLDDMYVYSSTFVLERGGLGLDVVASIPCPALS